MRLSYFLPLTALLGVATACGSNTTKTSGAPKSWLGASPHVRAVGTLDGETIDIDVSGAAAQDITKLWCEREYQVPISNNGNYLYDQGRNVEFRIKLPITAKGQTRLLDFQVKRHNTQSDAAGTRVTVVPRNDLNPPCVVSGCSAPTHAWFQWVWRQMDETVILKTAAQSGTFTVGRFTGSPDATGLFITTNTGAVGGFVDATWSASDHIAVSFDANCTENNVENG